MEEPQPHMELVGGGGVAATAALFSAVNAAGLSCISPGPRCFAPMRNSLVPEPHAGC